MDKHAYLIMAYRQFDILEKILRILDDERNDFYIHIDKKTAGFDPEVIKGTVKKSEIHFLPRRNISWGAYNSIKCEVDLLRFARENRKYAYYHLISGADMPIKTPDEIYSFFEEQSQGRELVHFCTDEADDFTMLRIKHYHPFRNKPRDSRFYGILRSAASRIQTIMRVDRTKKANLRFGFGANWFSITDQLAEYVVNNEAFIEKHFKSSSCADEIFLQTMVLNSEFVDRLYQSDLKNPDCSSIMRLIDWKRGEPYTFKKEDFDELVSSKMLFARKFDSELYPEIIDMIFETVMKKKEHSDAVRTR